MHYVLEPDHNPIIAGTLEHEESEALWAEGCVLPPIKAVLPIKLYGSYDLLPDFFEVGGTPIVSPAFLAVLDALAIDNWDAYPIRFTHQDNTDFMALNILGALEAVDRENAEFIVDSDQDPDDEVIESIQNLVLKTEGIEGFHLFRLADLPETLIVTEAVAEKMQALKGIKITAVDQWISYQY